MQPRAHVIQRQDEPHGFIVEHKTTSTFWAREELLIETNFNWLVLKYLLFLKQATSTEVKISSCKALLNAEKITD